MAILQPIYFMKISILLFVCFLFPLTAFGQRDKTSPTFFSIQLTPSHLLSKSYPTAMVGVEARPVSWLGIQLEHGFQTLPSGSHSDRLNWTYQKNRLDLKFYVKQQGGSWIYLAGGLQSVPVKFERENSHILLRDGRRLGYTHASFVEEQWALIGTVGGRVFWYQGFFFESYFGAGSSGYVLAATHLTNQSSLPTSSSSPLPGTDPGDDGLEQDRRYFTFDFGLRLGWSF